MESPRLLVVDQSPEQAEEINSLLRNSGINVRVEFAASSKDSDVFLNDFKPFLIIVNTGQSEELPVVEVLDLAEKYQVPILLRVTQSHLDLLNDALSYHSCLVVNSDENEQLVKLVRSLLEGNSGAQSLDALKSRLEELQSRYNLLLDSSNECIAYIHEGFHVYANRAYLELMNASDFSEIQAVSLLEFMQSEQLDLKKLLREMNDGSMPGENVSVGIRNLNGSVIDAELVFSAARYDGEDCIQMLVQQPDTNAALKSELERLRKTDPLTGLANRKTFTEQLQQIIDQEQTATTHSAVFYLQADGADALRESLGLSGWESFMQTMGGVVQNCLGGDDLAARLDDLGFAILANRDNKTELAELGDHIGAELKKLHIEGGKRDISATCSIGVAGLGSLSCDLNEILGNAISAFSTASEEGDCVHRYRPKSIPKSVDGEDLQWVERIKFAMDNQDFYTVQYTIVNLEEETEGLFESKTFMREDTGDISSDQFMPVAERNGLGAMIDRHIIQGLMSNIAGSGDRHLISISENSLQDFSFPSWLRHQLDEYAVPGTQLILSVTAATADSGIKSVVRLIEELSPSGCEFAISGFDGQKPRLAMLDKASFSFLSLRTGLTENLANNPENLEEIKSVVHAAQSSKVGVIAHEVSDSADLASLWQCGVKLVAGNFLKETHQVAG